MSETSGRRRAHEWLERAPLSAITASLRSRERTRARRDLLAMLACLALVPGASHAMLYGDEVQLSASTTSPAYTVFFSGSAVVADAPVDFTFDDDSTDAMGDPKYIWEVDFTGPDGLTVVITATRMAQNFGDIGQNFDSFEFTGINWIGAPQTITNATITGISGTQPAPWQGGFAAITDVDSDSFTFEVLNWTAETVNPGDTIIATIQLEVQPVPPTGDTYEYDALGRLTRVFYPDGSSLVYNYDRSGNLTSRIRVPEPGAVPLLLAGVIALVGLDRRRRRPARRLRARDRKIVRGLVGAVALLALCSPAPSTAQGNGRPADAPDWREAVHDRITESEYEVSWRPTTLRQAREAWQAPNRAQGIRTWFLDDGIRVTSREHVDTPWEIGLTFVAWGRGDEASPAESGRPRADARRVLYHRGPVVEWFVNDRTGLEQGFTLSAPPRAAPGGRGRGAAGDPAPVWVALRIDGDVRPELAADGQSVRFVRAGSPVALAHYDHLVVVDADGRTLDSWMEIDRDASGHRIRLVFDDADAAYPVEIDPLLTTPGWSTSGTQSTEGLGFSVSGAGDVNGDGFDDVLVGAPWYDGGSVDTGRAYLFLGSPFGLSAVAAWYAIGESPLGTRAPGPPSSRFGYSVASAGDVDADGYDDILVARVPTDSSSLSGQVFLYRGAPTGPGDVATWTLDGFASRRLGYSIAGVGDLNADGYDDVAFGEPGPLQSDQQGRVYVFYGQPPNGSGGLSMGGGTRCVASSFAPSGISCNGIVGGGSGIPQPVAWGEAGSQNEYGEVVAAAGDVNDDGFDDLVLGQPRFGGGDRGRIQIYFGSGSGITGGIGSHDYELLGQDVPTSPFPGNWDLEFGRAIVSAGALNDFPNPGAGADLLIGAPGRDPRIIYGNELDGENNGSVFVLRSDGANPPNFTLQEFAVGTIDRGTFGASLANVGDVDGDGGDDFLVGAPGEPGYPETAGRAYLYYGPASSLDALDNNAVWRADGAEADDYLGSALAGAGDVDNDGYADLLIGSATARAGRSTISEIPPTGRGSAFVFYGSAPIASLGELLGTDIGGLVTESFAWVGAYSDTIIPSGSANPTVGRGPAPDSLILSTGLAQDEGAGDTDWDLDGLPDKVAAGFVINVPPGMETLRFTTQYLTADPSGTRAPASIEYKYNPIGVGDAPMPELLLDTPIEEAGSGKAHAPISHAIDVSGPGITQVGLRLIVTEPAGAPPAPAQDTAVVLSKIFFTDLPLPDYLSTAPSFPDSAPTDGRADYVTNPRPSDVSASAGPFRYSIGLLDVPGKLLPFRLGLSYDSERTREEQLGPKWSHSLASSATEIPDADGDGCAESVFVRLGLGQVEIYDDSDDPACEFSPRHPGVFSTLVYDDIDNFYTHTTKDNLRSEFNSGVSTYPRSYIAHPNAIAPSAGQAILFGYAPSSDDIDFVEDTRGERYDFEYDDTFDPPRLVSVTGPGVQITFGYGAQGFLSSIIDANGLETTFTYDDDGKMLTITDADGIRFVSNEYEEFAGFGVDQEGDRVVRQLNAVPGDIGRTTSYAGDALERADREDGLVAERYDVFGRLVERRVLLDSTVSTTLDGCSRGLLWCAVWDYVYDEQNLVVQETNPLGFVTNREFDTATGNLLCETRDVGSAADPIRSRTAALYDARNNVIARLVARAESIESSLPACPLPGDTLVDLGPTPENEWLITTFTYDGAFDYLLSSTDGSGNTTTYTYDQVDGSPEEGLLQSSTNGASETTTYTYDSLGHPRSVTRPGNEVTVFTADVLGRRTTTTDPAGRTRLVSYDAGGRILATVNPTLAALPDGPFFQSFTYDAQGRLLTRTNEIGDVWTRSYTLTGRLEVETDPLGNATRYAYDAEDRLTAKTTPTGGTVSRSYDSAGRLESVTDPFGGVYAFSYDEAGNLLTETSPPTDLANPPSTTTYTYDGLGRQTSVQDALDGAGDETLFTYDSRGQLLTRTEPHPTAVDSVWTSSWTDNGQIASTTDPMGVTTTWVYDAANRVDLLSDVFTGRVTDFDYDTAGRIGSVEVRVGTDVLTSTDARYDGAGNTTEIRDPNSLLFNVVEYDYDEMNRVVAERDALGNEIQFAYEARGLLSQVTKARSQPGPGLEVTLDYAYDQAGRLTGLSGEDVATGSWSITEVLDANGNSTASLVSSSAAISVVSRSFDALDRPTGRSVDLPTTPVAIQPSVSSEYDAAGNLSAVIYSDGRRVEYAYDALNRLTRVRDFEDLLQTDFKDTTYGYDVSGNLSLITRPDGSQTTMTYDLAGRPLTIVDSNPVLPDPTIFQALFTVDGAGRRIDASFDLPQDPDPSAEPDTFFTFDEANRLATRDDGSTVDTFVYDEDGNLIQGRLGGAPGDLNLEYNALNQLVGVGTDVIRYDADGRRASRQTATGTTFYLYDTEGRLIEELDESGAIIARYVHGLGLVSREDGSSGAVSLYHYDSRGSTVALTDATTGDVTDTYAYLPYGAVQAGAANSTPNPFTYNGRDGVVDDGNGLYHMQLRYYAPELMRFVQKDPVYQGELARPLSLNRYAFVEGNPIERIDPTGAIFGDVVDFFEDAGDAIEDAYDTVEDAIGDEIVDIAEFTAAVTGTQFLADQVGGFDRLALYAAAGALIVATGGSATPFLVGAVAGGGFAAATGGNIVDGAVFGAIAGTGLGGAALGGFGQGFLGSEGNFGDKLLGGAIGASIGVVARGVASKAVPYSAVVPAGSATRLTQAGAGSAFAGAQASVTRLAETSLRQSVRNTLRGSVKFGLNQAIQ